MKMMVFVFVLCVAASVVAQSASGKYQPGTIMSVNPHPVASGSDSSVTSYDISLKVGSTTYVVLYTPPPGTYGVEYKAGLDLLVLVGEKTIKFNDMLGNSRTVPIVSRKPSPPKSSR